MNKKITVMIVYLVISIYSSGLAGAAGLEGVNLTNLQPAPAAPAPAPVIPVLARLPGHVSDLRIEVNGTKMLAEMFAKKYGLNRHGLFEWRTDYPSAVYKVNGIQGDAAVIFVASNIGEPVLPGALITKVVDGGTATSDYRIFVPRRMMDETLVDFKKMMAEFDPLGVKRQARLDALKTPAEIQAEKAAEQLRIEAARIEYEKDAALKLLEEKKAQEALRVKQANDAIYWDKQRVLKESAAKAAQARLNTVVTELPKASYELPERTSGQRILADQFGKTYSLKPGIFGWDTDCPQRYSVPGIKGKSVVFFVYSNVGAPEIPGAKVDLMFGGKGTGSTAHYRIVVPEAMVTSVESRMQDVVRGKIPERPTQAAAENSPAKLGNRQGYSAGKVSPGAAQNGNVLLDDTLLLPNADGTAAIKAPAEPSRISLAVDKVVGSKAFDYAIQGIGYGLYVYAAWEKSKEIDAEVKRGNLTSASAKFAGFSAMTVAIPAVATACAPYLENPNIYAGAALAAGCTAFGLVGVDGTVSRLVERFGPPLADAIYSTRAGKQASDWSAEKARELGWIPAVPQVVTLPVTRQAKNLR